MRQLLVTARELFGVDSRESLTKTPPTAAAQNLHRDSIDYDNFFAEKCGDEY